MNTELKEAMPRPLTQRETRWIRDILNVNEEWRDADISKTQVVSYGPCDEGVSIMLQAHEPENPKSKSRRPSIGSLWIQVDDGSIIDVQLSQSDGRLKEIYVLFVDPKHPKRTLPETWTEVSHEATDI
jgi:hypothetical protein